jgi:hypothetical protein
MRSEVLGFAAILVALVGWLRPDHSVTAQSSPHILTRRYMVPGTFYPTSLKNSPRYSMHRFLLACPGSEHVLSRGYQVTAGGKPGPTSVLVLSSYPESASTWAVAAWNSDTKLQPVFVSVICAT